MDRRVVDALPTPHHNNPNNHTATTTTPTVETDTNTPTTTAAMHLQTTAPSNYSPPLPHGSPPFQITPEDVELLAHSGGFAILRDHLAEYYNYE